MTDIVERLRARDFSYFDGIQRRRSDELSGLAADEIEKLLAENRDLHLELALLKTANKGGGT